MFSIRINSRDLFVTQDHQVIFDELVGQAQNAYQAMKLATDFMNWLTA